MISLFRLLHEVAAERGDGLHPELRKRLSKVDTDRLAEQVEADADRSAGDPAYWR